ncbi:MAG: adenylosuccinate lyase [Verrucomicrobiae bacterium]|nr:adenylosuccinate lyase [Verrucomicrobiae bacterium]
MIARYTRPEMAAIWTDENKLAVWLRIEVLACEGRHKILREIPARDLAIIKRRAGFSVARCRAIEKRTNHDVIAFLENVAERIGKKPARHVHQGLTSSDLLDTTLAVQMRQSAELLLREMDGLLRAVAKRAREHRDTPMMGRSHGVHAEPITFGLKMALMHDEFGRARARLERAREEISVGKLSGAVGTRAHFNPRVEAWVCRRLGLRAATLATQVIQRDRHAAFMAALALAAASIERWAIEFRHLQRTEVLEVEERFAAGQKGSSAMPHKRNPITAERLTGQARILRGNLVAALENVALWHERDISHSSVERVILPDSCILLDFMLADLAKLVAGMKVYPDRMRRNMARSKGLHHSQQVLLALTEKGLPRKEAYELVQRAAMAAWNDPGAADFREHLEREPRLRALFTAKDFARCFDDSAHFRHNPWVFRKLGLA